MKKLLIVFFLLLSSSIWAISLKEALAVGDIDKINYFLNRFYTPPKVTRSIWIPDEIDEQQMREFCLLNANELRLLRNTIFAMHGYRFKSKDLQGYFTRLTWYNGTKDNVDNELTEKEQGIIEIIQKIEENYTKIKFENIAGTYSLTQFVIGYEKIGIFPNGIIIMCGKNDNPERIYGNVIFGILKPLWDSDNDPTHLEFSSLLKWPVFNVRINQQEKIDENPFKTWEFCE
jgi:hypothetical protein